MPLLLYLLLASVSLHALNPRQSLRQYAQRLWQTDAGLPQNSVHAVRQTSDGYLWLATDGGLVRFDGIDFAVFDRHSAPVMRSNLIAALAETRDGTLWAATADGLIERRNGTLSLFGTAAGLPPGPITNVLPGAGGQLWVMTPGGVYFSADAGGSHRFARVDGVDKLIATRDGASVVAVGADGSLWVAAADRVLQLQDGRMRTSLPVAEQLLACGSDGSLWLATSTGLLRFKQGVLAPVSLGLTGARPDSTAEVDRSGGAQPLHIQAMAATRHGGLAFATTAGLGLLDAGGLVWTPATDAQHANRVERLYEDHSGALWVITANTLARYYAGHYETLQQGGANTSVEDIYEDREGNLWLGTTAAGLLELHPQRFTSITAADGLPADSVRTLLAGSENTLWAGTDGGGVARSTGGAWKTFTTQQGLASDTILSLAQQQDGSIAVGTPDGLDRLVAGHAAGHPAESYLPDDFVRSVLGDSRDGSLWIGTRRGLAHQSSSGITTWTQNDGLGSDLVGAITLDGQQAGSVWVGTRGGLSHLDRGHITNFTTRDGLSSDVITALYQDAGGAIWIGTNGGGLNLLLQGKIWAFPVTLELPEVIHSILEDGRGNLWLGSTTGVYRVARAQLQAVASGTSSHAEIAAYGLADGMRTDECSSGHPAAVRTADGQLWFATLRGISVTDPDHTEENRIPPPVAIENISVDDQPASADQPLRVAAGHSRLALHYAGLSFVAPGRVRYRYRLAGFDQQWIDAGTRRIAYYTNIPPGRYTFQVMAANNDGVWNQTGASIDIHVLPFVYQTWWFRLLLVLGTLALGWQLYRMRVRSVESRFAAVLAERTRIAREIHDTLAQDIVGISVQLELVSRLLGSSVEAARTQLDTARSLVKNSLAEARSSIWNLRSASAAEGDLPTRMNRALTQAAATGTARLVFAVHGTYRAAPPELEAELLRVAQEAVNNAVRHAAATRISVTLEYDPHAVGLVVEDDGKGFVPDAKTFVEQGHFGLRGMEERAQQIGGTLRVHTEPAKGTRISLRAEIP